MSIRRTVSVLLVSLLAPATSGAVSFSIDSSSPAVTTLLGGVPDDVYVELPAGTPTPVLPVAPLFFSGANLLEVDALSFGRGVPSFTVTDPALFSVDRGAAGLVGTQLSVEFNAATGSEQSSDVFRSGYTGANTLFRDGDGVATGTNPAARPLGVAEPASFPVPPVPPPSLVGDVDAIDARGDVFSGAGSPTGVIFFSIASANAGLYGAGGSGADVYIAGGAGGYDAATPGPGLPLAPGGSPQPYASGAALGLLAGDDIDALVVFDDGDNVFLPGTDIVVFSLAPGSASVGTLDPGSGLLITEGDILMSSGGPATILHTAESIGLRTVRSLAGADDNLNALDIVPEPTSAGLLGLGLAGLALVRRRSAPASR